MNVTNRVHARLLRALQNESASSDEGNALIHTLHTYIEKFSYTRTVCTRFDIVNQIYCVSHTYITMIVVHSDVWSLQHY